MSGIGLNAVSTRESTTASAISSNSAMGKDDFLTLLVAQLQHQDPLNPMNDTDFTAQLAQFSSLEQLQNINTNLENIDTSQNIQTNSGAVSFIGRNVTASGNGIYVSDGQAGDIHFELAEDAAAVYISVYDASGNFVRDLEYEGLTSGQQDLSWDGYDYLDGQLPDGNYYYDISAVAVDGHEVDVTSFTSGLVTGVNYKNGQAYLITEHQEIAMGDVIEVVDP